MNKEEFLYGLRSILEQELPYPEVESNLRFYEEYISTNSKGKEEYIILEELGDPRLIGKTIIETYQLSHGTSSKQEKVQYEESYGYENEGGHNRGPRVRSFQVNMKSGLKWYQKATIFILVAILIFLVVWLGTILIQLFFTIGIPLFIIYVAYLVIKNSFKR